MPTPRQRSHPPGRTRWLNGFDVFSEKTSFALIDDGAVSTQRSSRTGLRQIRTTRPWKIHGTIEQCPIHDVRQQGISPPAEPTFRRHAKADFHGQDGAQTTFHFQFRKWWSQTGSNRRPHACKARALPTELWPQTLLKAATWEREARHEIEQETDWKGGGPGTTRTSDLTLIRGAL